MSSSFSSYTKSAPAPANCSAVSFLMVSISSLRKNAFLTGAAICVRFLYDSTNFIRPFADVAIVWSPALISGACESVFPSSEASDSAYFTRASLKEAIGVTVFMISCVSTLISLVQEADSFSSMSLLMSLNATIFTFFPRISASEAVMDIVTLDDSLK